MKHSSTRCLVPTLLCLFLVLVPRLYPQEHGLLREIYTDISGLYVTDLVNHPTYPDQPTARHLVTDYFEAPTNIDEYYGQRMHGLLTAPVSGEYRFWIASDDYGELWLSTDETLDNARLIAHVPGATGVREWGRHPGSQVSDPIPLIEGQRYYISALMKEHTGGDHLSVRWQLPDGAIEEPIPASRFTPPVWSPPEIVSQPHDVTVLEGDSARFEVKVSNFDALTYQWWQGDSIIPDADGPIHIVPRASLQDDGETFYVVIENALGTVTSEVATLSVLRDSVAPEAVSVHNLGKQTVVIHFSEKLDPSSAEDPGNYALDGGVSVLDATWDEEGLLVRLTTSILPYDVPLQLTLTDIQDLAATPNTIASDTAFVFVPKTGAMRLNEGMASNGQTIADERGDFQDWIELFNEGGESVNLAGWGLSDDEEDPFKWQFPSGTIVDAREYLLVWSSGNDTVGTTREEDILLPGSTWRYYDRGSALGSEWRELEYDDSRWDAGPAPLGFSPVANYETTRISYGRYPDNKHITTYFRTDFEIEDAAAVQGLVLHLWLDDGAVLYLNGQEIHRENMPDGTIDSETRALNGIGSRPEWIRVDLDADSLVDGRNVLAVEVHQITSTSSDLGFDLRLEASVFEPILHTNFGYSADGEEIFLTRWDGVRVDSMPAKAMESDISFGRSRKDPTRWVSFAHPTPGHENAGAAGERIPAEVIFSEAAGTFTGSLTLELTGANEPQIIRYTRDGSSPTATSMRYEAPIQIEETTLVRARVFDENGASGPIRSQQYLRLAASLANRQSHLPQIVLDVAGQTMDPQAMERRAGYFQLFDVGEGGVSDLTRAPDLATRQGLRWRGRSSLGFPKKPYAVEFWSEANDDKSLEVLGMASESDWVLYSPYNYDRAYIRNSLMYDLSRDIGRWAPASRFVEVFFNADGGDLGENDYVGVYAIVERIKQGSDRLGHENVAPGAVPPEGEIDVQAPGSWTGGYIFKIDQADSDEYEWSTNQGRLLVLSRPKLIDLDGGPHASRSDATQFSRQAAYLRAYVQAFEDALEEDQGSGFLTREYLNYIEVDSWVDHLLLNAFAKNVDALRLSAYYHKPRNGKIVAGPLWDFDRSLDSYDVRDDAWNTWFGTGDATRYFEYGWWQTLCADPDFAQAFYDRWAELRNGKFSDSQLAMRIQEMGEEIDQSSDATGSAAVRDAFRWASNRHINGVYMDEIAKIQEWALQRAAWMDRRRFDSTLLPEPPRAGSMRDLAETGEITFSAPSGSIYFAAAGADPRASGGGIAGELYQGPIEANVGMIITARVRAPDGSWSTPTVVEVDTSLPGEEPTLMHYWSFNDEHLLPDFSFGGAGIHLTDGPETQIEYDDGSDFEGVNARMGEEAGLHLRVNDPLGAALTLEMPTTGYERLTLSYETRRSGNGAGIQHLSYTVNGADYLSWPTAIVTEDDAPNLQIFDFSGISAANNNPDFAVRIAFAEGEGGDGGNNRFDNFALEGHPLPGVNQPPEVLMNPGLVEMIAGKTLLLSLEDLFTDPDGDTLTHDASSSQPAVATVELTTDALTIQALGQGETEIILTAGDGENPTVMIGFRVLVYPEPFALADGEFAFDEWLSSEPAGSYPAYMLFLQSDKDDPDLDDPLAFAYQIPADDASSPGDADYPYAATSRTRINGLDGQGIAFINTGRNRDVGSALVALDTRGASEIDVSWTAETLVANERAYAIRLQFRTGLEEPWSDLLDSEGQPVEYVRTTIPGETVIGPVRLPESLEALPYVQLQWKYHHLSGSSGPRDQLRLDNITIASAAETDSYASWLERAFPDPADRADPEISGPTADPMGQGIPNLLRYALDIDDAEAARAQLPQPEVDEDHLVLLFRRDPTKTDIAYIVEATSDLRNWGELLYDSRIHTEENTHGEYQRVEDTQAVSEAEVPRFLRLRIEQQ